MNVEYERQDLSTKSDSPDSVYISDLKCVIRFKKPDYKLLPIIDEYQGIGFISYSGSLRQRAPYEQIEIIDKCKELGIYLPKPIAYIHGGKFYSASPETTQNIFFAARVLSVIEERRQSSALVFPFIPGITLADFLQSPANNEEETDLKYQAIGAQMDNLCKAHEANIVIGDRWGPNQIVVNVVTNNNSEAFLMPQTDKVKLAHIDIDLDITRHSKTGEFNPASREFEAAQVLYHLAYWTTSTERQEMIQSCLIPTWNIHRANYDMMKLQIMLRGHIDYFNMHNRAYAYSESRLLETLLFT